MPGCQEEDSVPRTEALNDRLAAFLLPGSASLPSSDGIDVSCGEVGTSWRLVLRPLVQSGWNLWLPGPDFPTAMGGCSLQLGPSDS